MALGLPIRAATALVAIAAIVAQLQTLAAAKTLNLVNFFSSFTIQSNLLGTVALGGAAILGSKARPNRRAS